MAGITTATQNRSTFKFTAIGAAGTGTCDIPIPTDSVVRVEARVSFVQSSAGHVSASASLVAEAVFANKNGVVTLVTVIATSANPNNSNTAVQLTARAEASDIGGTPTAVWSVSTTNGRLTITNSSGSAADALVFVDFWVASDI